MLGPLPLAALLLQLGTPSTPLADTQREPAPTESSSPPAILVESPVPESPAPESPAPESPALDSPALESSEPARTQDRRAEAATIAGVTAGLISVAGLAAGGVFLVRTAETLQSGALWGAMAVAAGVSVLGAGVATTIALALYAPEQAILGALAAPLGALAVSSAAVPVAVGVGFVVGLVSGGVYAALAFHEQGWAGLLVPMVLGFFGGYVVAPVLAVGVVSVGVPVALTYSLVSDAE